MAAIPLKYGRRTVTLELECGFDVIGGDTGKAALTDVEVGDRLDHPIGSPPVDEIVSPGESVLIVVPDATRETASGQMVNLLVRRLIAAGTAPHEINIIFATGIHRAVTEDEKSSILTPFIAQRIKTIDHGPRDLARLVRVGETSGGIPVELNRALVEYDRVITVGGVTFHYFAGFTGGRKLICPGLASAGTIARTHKLAFDPAELSRTRGVGPGILDGNAVHEAFLEAAAMRPPDFAVNTMVNSAGEATDVFCGDWQVSHRAACDTYSARHTVGIAAKRQAVIVSCGGYPFDINMIQAHKSLDAAAAACTDGGTIVLLAECRDGLGRSDFIDWFDAADSREMAQTLAQKYQVNGQTAWSLLEKAERFEVRLMSSLDDETVKKMRLAPIDESGLNELVRGGAPAFIMPDGAKYLARLLS